MTAPYHAEAFFVMAGRCFRMISGGAGEAGPTHCPQTPVWRGRFQARDGRWYTLDACNGHSGPPHDPRPIQPHHNPG